MDSVLVTDAQFIYQEEEAMLLAAGYRVERLDILKATETQLVEAVKGKVGYILGGIEDITGPVIAAADDLKAIVFCGSGFREHIPAWEEATKRGIAIATTRGSNAVSVAEFAIAAITGQVKNYPALTTPGGTSYSVTREFSTLTVGVIGYGEVGKVLGRKLRALDFTVLATTDRATGGVTAATLDEILSNADIVVVSASASRGEVVLNAANIAELKDGAILVNVARETAVDNAALLLRLATGTIRAAVDYPLDSTGLPVGALSSSNGQAAFNTAEANKRTSERATKTIINLLQTGKDPHLVNPEYSQYR